MQKLQVIILQLVKRFLTMIRPLLPKSLERFYRAYRWSRPLVDRSQVYLLAEQSFLPGYSPRLLPGSSAESAHSIRVSLIATCRNEASTLESWLDSLSQQERLPDEVVICDGGSTDGTLEMLRRRAASFPVNLIVLEAPGSNIARGRNLAIQHAAHEIIACSDLGCTLRPDWLRRLVAPFELEAEIALSAGYYEALQTNTISRLAADLFGVHLEAVQPQAFLPSSRSLAFKKSLWEQAGGYPEWLTDAGEDTLFDYQLKAQPARWAFVPEARVSWRTPDRLFKLLRTYARYARGDGETGIAAELYWYKTVEVTITYSRRLLLLVAGAALTALFWPAGLLYWTAWMGLTVLSLHRDNQEHSRRLGVAFFPYTLLLDWLGVVQMLGFAAGVRNRGQVQQRQVQHYQAQLRRILQNNQPSKGVIVYPPTHDWAFMFQRPHQMARAFARSGYLYFYCTANERTDAVFGFQHIEPNLVLCHVPLETFKILEKPIVYLGSPWNRQYLEHFSQPCVIYDHYDDLQVSGARPEDHQALLREAKIVLVTAQGLQKSVEKQRPDALLLPNGVDYDLIQSLQPKPGACPPLDWPLGDESSPVIGYSGALAAWFDYPLMDYLAKARPAWRFVLLGVDYDGSLPESKLLENANVHWLSMKPYPELFSYLWRFAVGVIPFRVNEITLATSPIKLFEYMACRLPVVSTALPECRRYPGVLVAEDPAQFLEMLDKALAARLDPAYLETIDQVARSNTWKRRALAVSEKLSACWATQQK